MSAITPINPERRDPGSLRKKSDIGLSNVDNLSTNDYINIILGLVKDNINEDDIYTIGKSDPGTKRIGICQFTTKTAHSSITIGLINPSNEILECINLEAIYTDSDSGGIVDCKSFVSLNNTYLKDSKILFFEKEDSVEDKKICNVILELPTEINGNITKIGINIFEYTPGTKKLDSTKVNDLNMYGAEFSLVYELSCEDSYLGANTSGSALGLAIYDENGKIVKVENGVALNSSDNYNFPKINGVPFIGYLNSTIDDKSGRDITVTSKHSGPTKTQAGEHSWDVLANHPQVGLIEVEGGYNSTTFPSTSLDYGLCKVSKYTTLPIYTESVDLMINNLITWGNSLSSVNDDVIPVGALKEAITYISKTLGVMAGTIVADKRYTFMFQDSSHSSTTVPITETDLTYRVISILDTITADGNTETSYPAVTVKLIDYGDSDVEWMTAEIQGTGNNQNLVINILENDENDVRRGSITVTQAESNNVLQYNINQDAGNTVIGFRINNTLVTQGNYYNINQSSLAFNNLEYALYPVIISNGVETKAEFTDFNLLVNKLDGPWLTLITEEEDYVENDVTYKRKTLNLSASENTSISSSRTSTISVSYKDTPITIQVTQAEAEAFLYINGDMTNSTYILPNISSNAQESSVIIQSNYSWAAAENLDWVTVTPSSGTAGETSLNISVTKNFETIERTGAIQLKANNITKYISLTQDASSVYLYLNEVAGDLSLNFTYEGGDIDSKSVAIKSNTAWEITDKPAWVTLNQISGGIAGVETNTPINITADPNTSPDDRTNGIIKIVGGGSERRIVVSQSGTGAVTISPNPYNVSYNTYNDITTETTINVLSNDIYTITTSDSWIWLSSASAGSSSQGIVSSMFTMRLSEINTSGYTRTGEIVLTSITDPTVTSSISVVQKGNIVLNLSSSQLSISAVSHSPTENYITVSTNVDHAIISNFASFPSWLTTNPTAGSNINSGDNLFVITQENKTESDRSFQIRITSSNDTGDQVVKFLDVTQMAGVVSSRTETLSVMADSDLDIVTSSGGIVTLSCKVNEKITTVINGVDDSSTTYYSVIKTIAQGAWFDLESGDGAAISNSILTIPENISDLAKTYIVRANFDGVASSGEGSKSIIQSSPSKTIWYEYSDLVITPASTTMISSGGSVLLQLGATRKTHEIVNQVDSVISTSSISNLTGTTFSWVSKPSTVPTNWVIEDNGNTILFNENTDGSVTKVATVNASYSFNFTNPDGSTTPTSIQSANVTITQAAAEGTISVSLSEYSLAATDSSATISVISNALWDITPTESTYFTISPSTGGPGSTPISIVAKANNTSSSATPWDTFTLTTRSTSGSTTGTTTFRARQLGVSLYANVSETLGGPSVSTILSPAGDYTVTNTFWVNSNTDWTITDDEGFINYTVTPSTGTGNTEVTIYSESANFFPTLSHLGTASLEYLNNSGEISKTSFEVMQEGGAKSLITDTTETILGPLSGSIGIIKVLSNVSWTATTLGSGFSINRMSSTGNTNYVDIVVTATAASITSTTTTLGSVTISDGQGITRIVTIKQSSAKPYIAGTQGPVVLGATAGEMEDLVFTTNYSWTATINLTGYDPIYRSGTGGENKVVVLTAPTTNSTTEQVSLGSVRIDCTAPSGEVATLEKYIVQRQAYPYIIAPTSIYLEPNAGETTTITIQRNYAFTSQFYPEGIDMTATGASTFSVTSLEDNLSVNQSRYIGEIRLAIVDPLGDSSKTVIKVIDVYQKVANYYMDFNAGSLFLLADKPDDVVIPISTNSVNWSVTSEVLAEYPDQDWITVTKEGNSIRLSVPSRKYRDTTSTDLAYAEGTINTYYARKRKGVLYIHMEEDSSYEGVISITQYGYRNCLVIDGESYWGTDGDNKININPSNTSGSVSYNSGVYYKTFYQDFDSSEVTEETIYTAPSYTTYWTPDMNVQPYPVQVSLSNFSPSNPSHRNLLITLDSNTAAQPRDGYVRLAVYRYPDLSTQHVSVDYTFHQNVPNLTCTPSSFEFPAEGGDFSIDIDTTVSMSDVSIIRDPSKVLNGNLIARVGGGFIYSGKVSPNTGMTVQSGSLVTISIPGATQSINYSQHYFYINLTEVATGTVHDPNDYLLAKVGPGTSTVQYSINYQYSDTTLNLSSNVLDTVGSEITGSDYDREIDESTLYSVSLSEDKTKVLVNYDSTNELSTDRYREFSVSYKLMLNSSIAPGTSTWYSIIIAKQSL